MKKLLIVILVLNITFYVNAQSLKSILLPKNYSEVKTVEADLDDDGTAEKIILANTNTKLKSIDHNNFKRELLIYKKEKNDYTLWKIGSGFLISSQDGFYPEDNLVEISVKNNIFTIYQKYYLNSRNSEISKYIFRYQNNDLYLIGSSIRLEKNCDWNILNEINFSKGKIIIKEEYELCDEKEESPKKDYYKEFLHNFTKLIKFNEFEKGHNVIKVPNSKKNIIY